MKKILAFTLLCIFTASAGSAQETIVINEKIPVIVKKDLPMPQDPVTGGQRQLSRSDLLIKSRADRYLNAGEYDKAMNAVKAVSDEWSRHTFLSVIYEQQRKYKEALDEIDWMIDNCQEEFVKNGLINRRRVMEEMYRQQQRPDDYPKPEDKKAVLMDF